MGACDAGRCCKGNTCSDDKKCCCTAGKKGTHTPGEVCRSASCQRTNGSCDDNVNVCECESSGGTLAQSCDPCANVPCGKCERCVDGKCVSTCSLCQTCDTSTINGTCVDKCTGGGSVSPVTCGACQSCVCGQCVVTGQLCGFPIVTCCSASECCVNGTCKPCDCTGLPPPPPCHVCQSGQYVSSCTAAQRCCNGTCKECCVTNDCPSGKVCSNGVCVTPTCCKWEPACAPGGFGVYEVGGFCDPRGTEECPVVITPLACSDARCEYTWSGGAWASPRCVALLQGNYMLFDCGCSSSGCTPPSSAGAFEGDVAFGGNCAAASNPLP